MPAPTTRKPILSAAMILIATALHARADFPITTLASFSFSTGTHPAAGLTLSPDATTLYGTTYQGSANGLGAVFSVPVAGGTPTVLVSFHGTNGEFPHAGLTLSPDGSTLYGTTYQGGANGFYGAVFSVPVTGGTPTLLASFNQLNAYTYSGVTLSGNTLYGATLGGDYSRGTVYSVPITGGTPKVLATFGGAYGECPNGDLTLSGNTLYGATIGGGASNCGTIFAVPITGGTPTVLASFNGTNGQGPGGKLTLSGSTLYGTTSAGGASGYGTVFSLPITGGTPTVLASFNGTNGQGPNGNLTLLGNTLYGTTSAGGASGHGTDIYGDAIGYGTVFSIPITGGTPTVLASFDMTDGANPWAGLTFFGNTLFGTTNSGGANYDGTVFSISLPEPASLLLLSLAAPALLLRRRARGTRSLPLPRAHSDA
jgi:uncharacterized repeat protein (TIGR03803 family)